MIPLSKRSLDPEVCVQQGGHCFVWHTDREVPAWLAPVDNPYGLQVTQIVEVCRHCPAYRVGVQFPKNWVQWGEVQVRS